MAERRKTLAIIDGKSVFYRGYYAMPTLSLPDGTPTGGVYGFAVMALEIIKRLKPDYVVVAWDKPKTNIRARLKLYPQYKANRKPAPPDFYAQIPLLERLLDAFGWPFLECDDYEADDIMGTLSRDAHKAGVDTMLVTSDLDVIQLVNHHTRVAALKKGLTNIKFYDEDSFTAEYGLTPEQFIDVKALKGDSSDNIPGVAGVGEKTALELIKSYGTLDGVYQHLDDIKPTLRAKLERDRDMAYLSHKLVTILFDAPVKLDLKAADVHHVDPAAVKDILAEYQFRSLLAQLPESWRGKVDDKPKATISDSGKLAGLDAKAAADLIKSKPAMLALTCENDSRLLVSPEPERTYWLELDQAERIKNLLESAATLKVGFDLKCAARRLLGQGIMLEGISHDVQIGAFLLNPLIRRQNLSDLVGNGNELDPPQTLAAIWHLLEEQKASFQRLPKLAGLAETVEWPMINVLANMEHRGVRLDREQLAKLSEDLADRISDIEQEMYGHAGIEFNISSPSQLADVLFEKLQLPTQNIKKTRSGYSTAASELIKLRGLHPIIDLITKYREYTKLKSTYVDALPKLIGEDGKLHTTYDLDVAATGRLSSHNPNLQNIPVRGELSQPIRAAFEPEKGCVFISADYSQFELRIAAALAGEAEMIKAFNEGLDVHQLTAATMYGIPLDQVTKEQRYSAKAVNFGVMYGLGPHGLSVGTGMTMADAKTFIEKYFEARPMIRAYIEKLKVQAREQGYVETHFGRRRPTPDVKSSNFVVREAAMRQAVNMPMQGTAADLMKMAMIALDGQLDADCHMLLQIHDSLIIECPAAKAPAVGKQVKKIMEGIYPELGVKLQVDVKTGKNWGAL
jgi:DNA polymerase-1